MATKATQDVSSETIEEMLDVVDKTLERVKTLYEQYFLGIQKQAPAFLHNDIERKLRDLTQLQIRNTGLRYRLATLSQKFGSYNAYWRRTIRQIENGKYVRNLSKIGREAVRTGAAIPEEILAAMPKRMREQVVRDREQALAIAQRRTADETRQPAEDELLTLAPELPPPPPDDDVVAVINEPTELRRSLKTIGGAHIVDESDADLDLESFFASVEPDRAPSSAAPAPPPPEPAAAPAARPSVPMPVKPATAAIPKVPAPARPVPNMPSQVTRPIPIAPGAAAARGAVGVESMSGPFPRAPTPSPPPKPAPPMPKVPSPKPVALKPPPGMTDADVQSLYAKYVKAKELVGEQVGPNGYGKLLKTINAQAPRIMEQYKASGVDFSVVVRDNQVIIKAKPKT